MRTPLSSKASRKMVKWKSIEIWCIYSMPLWDHNTQLSRSTSSHKFALRLQWTVRSALCLSTIKCWNIVFSRIVNQVVCIFALSRIDFYPLSMGNATLCKCVCETHSIHYIRSQIVLGEIKTKFVENYCCCHIYISCIIIRRFLLILSTPHLCHTFHYIYTYGDGDGVSHKWNRRHWIAINAHTNVNACKCDRRQMSIRSVYIAYDKSSKPNRDIET